MSQMSQGWSRLADSQHMELELTKSRSEVSNCFGTMERQIASMAQTLARLEASSFPARPHGKSIASASDQQPHLPDSSLVSASGDNQVGFRSSSVVLASRESLLRKIELPVFDGHMPYGWICRVERYFRVGQYTEDQKLELVSLSLEGRVLNWFEVEMMEAPFVDWAQFKVRMLARFASVKIDLPVFEGHMPYGWLCCVERYFRVGQYTDAEKLELISLRLEGRVLTWFEGEQVDNPFTDWSQFKERMLARFAPAQTGSPSTEILKQAPVSHSTQTANLSCENDSITTVEKDSITPLEITDPIDGHESQTPDYGSKFQQVESPICEEPQAASMEKYSGFVFTDMPSHMGDGTVFMNHRETLTSDLHHREVFDHKAQALNGHKLQVTRKQRLSPKSWMFKYKRRHGQLKVHKLSPKSWRFTYILVHVGMMRQSHMSMLFHFRCWKTGLHQNEAERYDAARGDDIFLRNAARNQWLLQALLQQQLIICLKSWLFKYNLQKELRRIIHVMSTYRFFLVIADTDMMREWPLLRKCCRFWHFKYKVQEMVYWLRPTELLCCCKWPKQLVFVRDGEMFLVLHYLRDPFGASPGSLRVIVFPWVRNSGADVELILLIEHIIRLSTFVSESDMSSNQSRILDIAERFTSSRGENVAKSLDSKVRVRNSSKRTFVSAFYQSTCGDMSPNTLGTFCTATGLPCDFNHNTCNGKNELCYGRGPGYPDEFGSPRIIGEKQFKMAVQLFIKATEKLEGKIGFQHAYEDFSNLPVTVPKAGDGSETVRTCPAAMGFGFAAGTTDGPGAFDFKQGVDKGNKFWKLVRHVLITPGPEQDECQKPTPILLVTGRTVPTDDQALPGKFMLHHRRLLQEHKQKQRKCVKTWMFKYKLGDKLIFQEGSIDKLAGKLAIVKRRKFRDLMSNYQHLIELEGE